MAKNRVTIVFDYEVKMEYYPSDEVESASDTAVYDQVSYDNELLDIYALITWAGEDISVTIEPSPEESL